LILIVCLFDIKAIFFLFINAKAGNIKVTRFCIINWLDDVVTV